MERYDRKFYDDLRATALPSARRIVPILRNLMTIDSVVDVGCGNGAWLAVFAEEGVGRILGIDGGWIAADQLLIPQDRFSRAPLDEPFRIEECFDLAISLEVAEHLPVRLAAQFVDALCKLAPVVLFSAAIPEQGGHNHINEQWPAYWAALFERRGYLAVDLLRPMLWDDPVVTWWYKQNLVLFAERQALAAHPKLAEAQKGTRTPLLSPRTPGQIHDGGARRAAVLRQMVAAWSSGVARFSRQAP